MWHPFLGTPQQLSPSTTLGRLSADKLAVELFTADLAAAPGAAWIQNGNAWDSPGNCGKSRKLIDIDMQKKTTTISYWIATWWFPMGFPYLCLFNQG